MVRPAAYVGRMAPTAVELYEAALARYDESPCWSDDATAEQILEAAEALEIAAIIAQRHELLTVAVRAGMWRTASELRERAAHR